MPLLRLPVHFSYLATLSSYLNLLTLWSHNDGISHELIKNRIKDHGQLDGEDARRVVVARSRARGVGREVLLAGE